MYSALQETNLSGFAWKSVLDPRRKARDTRIQKRESVFRGVEVKLG